jgi:gliding motility-associated-like protein
MKSRYILLILVLLTGFSLKAQPPETTYAGTAAVIGYDDDNIYGPFNIGFNFTFYGNTYSQFYINSNGQVLFGTGSLESAEAAIPSATAPNNFIAPFWDDLVVDSYGNILYKTVGASLNRKLIIQFTNMGFYPYPANMGTFSVILYENTNVIQIQYRLIVLPSSIKAHGNSATIGIENSTGTAGVQYAYHNPSAISTEQAISFTPSGPTYTVNTDASYDGVYLTTNISLPEPGITTLISPPQNAVIGSDYTFDWGSATNATSYDLYLSNDPELTDAVLYSAGSNLSYDITGLLLDTIYYWGVFASNTTGTTWCEIKRFSTSSIPPLEPVPQTIWAEQSQDKTIKLNYTGGDASPKTAIITTLPAQGQLYQYNSGARGSLINLVPTALTDPAKNVIYAAPGANGNGIGNFKFKINDLSGDSPEGLITVNVLPPNTPNVLYVAKSTTYVEIQFDRPMSDPAGKQNQFLIKVNGSPVTISSAVLKTGDPNTIILSLATPLTGTETVLVSYTQGNVSSLAGGLLLTFTDQAVTLTAQTINFPQSLIKKYNESPFTITATASSGLGLTYTSSNTGVATFSSSVLTFHSVGTSDITLRQLGNSTYAPAYYIKTLTVSKGDQTITFNALAAKTYGDADFSLTATASSGLSVSFTSDNPAVATIAGNVVHITGAGSAVITASQAGNALWNPAASVPRTLTVNKATQTITFGALPVKTWGDPDFSGGASASSGLAVSYSSDNPAVATIVSGNIHIVGAGTAVITASQAGDANFNPASSVPHTLTVNKASQTITFSAFSNKTYGDVDFSPAATSSSGLSVSYSSNNTAVATIISGMVHIVTPGTAVITASQPGDGNYNPASDVPRTLTVNKANLTFTAQNETKEYLTVNPDLAYTITGYVNGETQAVLDVLPVIQTTALQNSPVGTYPITVSGGSDNCYSYVYVPGTMTITKIIQVITFTRVPESLMAVDTFHLSAVSSSGLEIIYESMDDQLATIAGNVLTGVAKGTVQIRAHNDGDQNYQAAEAFASVEITSTHKDIMYLFTPNGDGINDYWEIPNLVSLGKCDVKVYNRWGKLVYDNPDYNNLWDGTSNGNPLPEGAYYFLIKTENAGNIKGTVNIVR